MQPQGAELDGVESGEHPEKPRQENPVFYPVTLKNVTLILTATSIGCEREGLLRRGFTFLHSVA